MIFRQPEARAEGRTESAAEALGSRLGLPRLIYTNRSTAARSQMTEYGSLPALMPGP